ncbi:hypothetical protein F183_A10870 [Bryobacterales bacterium F-183]|nr:hypothetical protein F183_A10870 [Bryobacterales bacterium F-183]
MRIGIDTAILIRAHEKAAGPARELLLVLRETGHALILSSYVLDEVARVLHYPRLQKLFSLTEQEIDRHLAMLRSMADIVEPASGPPIVLEDPEDDPVVYTAIAGDADILCTVDKHFYALNVLAFCARHKIRVMTDVQLLRLLREIV